MQRRIVHSTAAAAAATATPEQPPVAHTTRLRKKRRANNGNNHNHNPVVAFQFRLARLIEEDGLFLLFVGFLGCILMVLILVVGYKLAMVLVGGDDADLREFRRRRNAQYGSQHLTRKFDDQTPPEPLPFNPAAYRVPEAMDTVGDRSTRYALLRQKYDTELLPPNEARSLAVLQSLQMDPPPKVMMTSSQPQVVHHSDQVQNDKIQNGIQYDIYNCPFDPPDNYPFEWNLVNEVLGNWPADDTRIPDQIHQGICVFDYRTDYDKAMNYRRHEVPFVVTNDPQVARTVERWSDPKYVEQMVSPDIKHRTEYNTNNHFLYHMPPPNIRGRSADNYKKKLERLQDARGRHAELQNAAEVPQALRMTFREWLHHANKTSTTVGPNDEHWYFRLIGCGYMGSDGSCDHGSTEALYDELPFFQPKPSLYVVDDKEQKGIHCRFGMAGVIAENHFDGARNAIAVLAGKRRYILAHPNQCANLALLPKEHPSARHSAVDYTQPDLERYPEFAQATSTEVLMQPGHVLYLPTNWFHFIVSLELNYQCNTRSGLSEHYMQPVHDCGF